MLVTLENLCINNVAFFLKLKKLTLFLFFSPGTLNMIGGRMKGYGLGFCFDQSYVITDVEREDDRFDHLLEAGNIS